jgi:hypothetical protein
MEKGGRDEGYERPGVLAWIVGLLALALLILLIGMRYVAHQPAQTGLVVPAAAVAPVGYAALSATLE